MKYFSKWYSIDIIIMITFVNNNSFVKNTHRQINKNETFYRTILVLTFNSFTVKQHKVFLLVCHNSAGGSLLYGCMYERYASFNLLRPRSFSIPPVNLLTQPVRR